MAYASQTSTSSAATRAELEKTLARYGADQFGYLSSSDSASVVFTMNERTIRFTIPLPNRNDREFTHTAERGIERSRSAAENAYEQAVRSKWRSLLLVVKAKLEAVEAGITLFEQEFYPQTVLPNGRTVYEETYEQVGHAIATRGTGALRLSIES